MANETQPQAEKTDALAKTEPKLEVIKRNGRDVAIARAKGRFANITTAATVELAKVIRQTTHTAKENGKTDFQEIVENNNAVAIANTEGKALGAVSQWVETLDILGGTRDARKNLQEPEAQHANLIVDTGGLAVQMLMPVITELSVRLAKYEAIPNNLRITNPDEVRDRTAKQPVFASEVPFAEAELVVQGTGQPAKAVKSERRKAQIPKPYCPAWRRKEDPRV